ncbi:hypothetical protein AYJ54_00785 [Bradyrhizobium centrolobii]|uniref:Uncharacterized protein n=1 Tax=Bradyrhizobium centrolobii TaxID=1505087 RepID=A0A176YFR5_9BRAD|nr:glycoside hydrolase family 108 protein [Bradyrhizobium centrolobii]OAF05474.1 hypothetical protein AYJ54_00785 [Bradyrhizobium centrolobii]
MTAENFSDCLRRVLIHEGGYSNDADDPGGATMWGITHIDYDAYRRRKGQPPQDVRRMTVTERDEIYHRKYWIGSRCDELPSGVDYCVFDGSVNSGVAQSTKWLQRALGVTVDGYIGDQTLLAASHVDPDNLIKDICAQRRRFLQSLRTFKTFGRGWMRRVNEVEKAATAMSENPNDRPPDTGAKAPPKDIKGAPVGTGTAAGGTTITTVLASIVQQIQDTLAPYSDTLSAIKYVLFAAALIGLGITAYTIWKHEQVKAVS